MRTASILFLLSLYLQSVGYCVTGFTPEVEVWKSELSGKVLGAGVRVRAPSRRTKIMPPALAPICISWALVPS